MSEELYNSNDYCSLAEQYEELKKENAELTADKAHLMNLFMESSEYIFDVVSNMKIDDLERKCKALEADYVISNRELLILQQRIAELEEKQRWIPVSERLPEIEEGDSKEYDVVITYPRESSVTVAWWAYNIFDKTHQRRIWIEYQGEFGHEDITKYVTHWRERPTPPEVK